MGELTPDMIYMLSSLRECLIEANQTTLSFSLPFLKHLVLSPKPIRNMQNFHVSATGHSLNYLPEFIAQRHGFFAEQGLDVTVTVPNPWDLVLDELESGTAQAALGGIWVPSMYRNRSNSYTAFAQASNRCPLALVKRGSSEGFHISETVGKTILMKSGNGASVGLFFKMMLRESRIDPNSLNFVQDLDGKMLAKLFEGGMGDYFVVDNITAIRMARANLSLSVAMEMARDGDEIPWSVYYDETDKITPAVLDTQTRFCTALEKGINWVLQHDAESFKNELAEIFPAIPVDILVRVTNMYRHNEMWKTPIISQKGFDRWQRGIADGSLISEPLEYDAIVNKLPATNAHTVKVNFTEASKKEEIIQKSAQVQVNEIQVVA